MRKIVVYNEKDSESGLYIGIVPSGPGTHIQVESLDELYRINR